ncbi:MULTISPECIES: DUF423 domain-containing protein [Myroides]|uniref:DUF423 domain-containing protein n=1 Tax=Myroides albus TaxID=2562892 RepID=A0A6I3LE88_9FLAO|nr:MULTISPECIES: DUF423 domain-containing protein [Myroides]MTG97769.1 DUF423 domain-containing protein [Myroides albus]MVX35547.1 DUF423 domain-containing protein [Myroides sp. LoEW2-1]UVD79710.1 DUF423 domain-containing protein [Myroides albus]UVD79725.1 DUF423 domain-containing protein [Myroides albus]
MINNITPLIAGSLFGGLAIIFGAFGAHALKKYMKSDSLTSFETGVKYQMYHAILLVAMAFMPKADQLAHAANIIIIGTILFSFSIYGLTLSSTFGKKIKILGPITPIGGLCLTIGWFIIFFYFSFIH